jgi:RNA 2',3'-cyclic 3'-phosphodiesterase
MKRTFIAVKIEAGEDFKEVVSTLRDGLANENIRWADINNLHITIAFIGETDETSVLDIKSMLERDLSGFGSIDFGLKGFGVFRNFKDPRILFTDIENPERLIEAWDIIKKGLDALDIKLEERSFRPHLTIGRIKYLRDRNNLEEMVRKYINVKLQNITVSEIVYYESVLLPQGSVYKPISIVQLNKA